MFSSSSFNLVVYSICRGGASSVFLQHNSMKRALLRGRWRSASVARAYVQDAVAEITSFQLSGVQRLNLQSAASWLRRLTAKAS
eukprot:11182249-Lingulodinium_polyedra.AAC.2